MTTRPIGIFDSGVGGLSVLLEIKKLLPNENYIFVADQAAVPYGGKSKQQLCNLSERIVNFLVSKNVKMVVVACNTSTCYSIDYIRNQHPDLPIVGTVPAVKKAAELSIKKSIAVMSTPATSKSPLLKNLIRDYAQGVKILNIGCHGLEDIVEHGFIDSPEVKILLRRYVSKALIKNPDYIVLGCTHYPFLKKIIQKIGNIKTIDSGKAIAKRVKFLLGKDISEGKKSRTIYYTTGNPKKFSIAASKLLGKRIKTFSLKL